MAKRTLNKNIRKITRMGKRSFGVTIPIDIVRSLGWRERQRVVARKIRGGIIIRDWKRR